VNNLAVQKWVASE